MDFILDNRPRAIPIVLDMSEYPTSDFPSVISDLELLKMYPSPADTRSQGSTGSVSEFSPHSIEAMSPEDARDIGYEDEPYLVITEQPTDKFRFRYKSEMAGTHGCLNGRFSDRTKQITFPTVELRNYPKQAVIRCSLYSADKTRSLHPHRLMREDETDPHDVEVGPRLGYTAVFSDMGIIHTAKKCLKDELKKKMEKYIKCKRVNKSDNLTVAEKAKIAREVDDCARKINLNSVSLGFEAYEFLPTGETGKQIGEIVYSEPINNSKSAMTGELKIVRMDKTVGTCGGGEEVFIFVEKVMKKNILVRFFELDKKGREVWSAQGIFNDLDVHHQYAIAFRTPKYRDENIKSDVNVFVELVRPSDGDRSEPREFKFKLEIKAGAKRRRVDRPLPLNEFNENPSQEILNGKDCLYHLDQVTEGMDSADFKKFFKDFDLETYGSIVHSGSSIGSSLEFDSRKRFPKIKSKNPVETFLLEAKDTFDKHLNTLNEDGQAQALMRLNKDGDSPFHVAIDHVMSDALRELKNRFILIKNAELRSQVVNIQNAVGETLLHRLIKHDLIEEIPIFVEFGVDPNIPNEKGDSAFHLALQYNKANEIVSAMFKSKIKLDLNTENSEGVLPLHLAIKQNKIDLVQTLLEYGADVNSICRNDGNTPLHLAVQNNHYEITSLILSSRDVDVNRPNFGENTASHIAEVEKNLQILSLLKSHVANDKILEIPNIKIEIKEEEMSEESEDEYFEDASESVIQTTKINSTGNDPIKSEVVDIKLEVVDIKEETYEFYFDDQCLDELARLLDPPKHYQLLAKLLNCEHLLCMYEAAASPTKALMQHQRKNLSCEENIKNALLALNITGLDSILQKMERRVL